jgi:transcriptional/translational regulatory protein YebC/TACO1
MAALEQGADDVVIGDDVVEVYTNRTDFMQVNQGLEAAGYKPANAELLMAPNSTLELAAQQAADVLTMVETLEELDDVGKVSHNLELTDAVVAQLAELA